MRLPVIVMMFAGVLVTSPEIARGQLTAASEGPVVYGHHHLNVTSAAEHSRFWTEALGGIPTPIGQGEMYKFPNVLLFVTEREPEGGTKGSTVNHIGFSVPNVSDALAKVRAAGYPVVTRQELPRSIVVEDGVAFIANQDAHIAFVMAPDDVKVELFEDRIQNEPIALHHIHFDGNDPEAMKSWYVDKFGAEPGVRGSFEAADLPGVNLTYSENASALAGTQGRSLDHIGFEVKDLKAFCEKLEADGIRFDIPYREIEQLGLAIAFLTDPWGTYIELTEGLDKF